MLIHCNIPIKIILYVLYLTYTVGVFFSTNFFLLILDYKIKFEKLLKHWEWLVSKYGYLQETNMKQLLVWVYHVDIFIELWISSNLPTRNQTVDVQNNWGNLPGGKIAISGRQLATAYLIFFYLICNLKALLNFDVMCMVILHAWISVLPSVYLVSTEGRREYWIL